MIWRTDIEIGYRSAGLRRMSFAGMFCMNSSPSRLNRVGAEQQQQWRIKASKMICLILMKRLLTCTDLFSESNDVDWKLHNDVGRRLSWKRFKLATSRNYSEIIWGRQLLRQSMICTQPIRALWPSYPHDERTECLDTRLRRFMKSLSHAAWLRE